MSVSRRYRSIRILVSPTFGALLFTWLFISHGSARASYPQFFDPVNYEAGRFPSSVVIGDLNGDGTLDLAIADQFISAPGMWVLLGNGDGTFAPGVLYPAVGSPRAVVMADLNSDGKPDLVTANDNNNTNGSISVLLGNADGTFATHIEHDLGFNAFRVAAGDLNADGYADLVVPHYGLAHKVSVLLGRGDGNFAPRVDYETAVDPLAALIGDLNDDGRPDLVVTGVSVLLGNGDGTFGTKVDYQTGSHLYLPAMGDLNGDGNLDLVAGSHDLLLGGGDGTFAPSVDIPTAIDPITVAMIADLDGDRKSDLVVGNTSSVLGPSKDVSVLPGNGDGTFGAALTYTTPTVPPGGSATYLGIGDLNGDGALDLVTVGRISTPTGNSGWVSVLLNTLLPARVRLEPRVINLSSHTPWVTVRIEVAGLDPGAIDVASLQLEGLAPASVDRTNGGRELSLKFSRAALDPLLEAGENELIVTGALVTGRRFTGRDRLRVIDPPEARPAEAAALELRRSTSVAPASMTPNPLRTSGVLTFTTTRHGPASVVIYDVRGRVVRILMDAPALPPGIHTARFDGRGQAGDLLPGALYFYRIQTREGSTAGRIAITR